MLGAGDQTDLFFERHGGIVEDREHFFAVRQPDDPGYYFGNYLLLKSPPTSSDRDWLEHAFAENIGKPPLINHFAFSWTARDQANDEDLEAFLEAGYEHGRDSVLLATSSALKQPNRTNERISIRTFTSDSDWQRWADLKRSERDEQWSLEDYETHISEQMALYRRLSSSGHGSWYGAFIDEELVGDLGLFFDGTLGRFQEVETKEAYRNQAICKTLVYEVSKLGFERAEELVMVADETYHAANIYESLGYVPKETQTNLLLTPNQPTTY